mmetsp:Transcript_3086/g.6388  ORF Transcript_3086/g.6388 Transcript_3086/m.6388 type:complete len:399 (+) Transcript_3086:57-1253(+)
MQRPQSLSYTTNRVCLAFKSGNSIKQISKQLNLLEDQVKECLALRSNLSMRAIETIISLWKRGLSLQEIRETCSVEQETLQKFMPDFGLSDEVRAQIFALSGTTDAAAICELLGISPETLELFLAFVADIPERAVAKVRHELQPRYIFSYEHGTNQLYKTTLETGEVNAVGLATMSFMQSTWSEVPNSRLIFTGGLNAFSRSKEVFCLNYLKEYSQTRLPFMINERQHHASIYYAGFLYVVGGGSYSHYRSQCERLNLAELVWEPFSDIPRPCNELSVAIVEITQCLFAFGGECYGELLRTIQRLSLERLSWDLLKIKLPNKIMRVACFKVDLADSVVYICTKTKIIAYSPLNNSIKATQALREQASSQSGPTNFCNGVLYCSRIDGKALRVEIGSVG